MRTFEEMEHGPRSIGYLAQRAMNFCRGHHVRIKSYKIKHTATGISLECNYHPFGQQPDVTPQVSDLEQQTLAVGNLGGLNGNEDKSTTATNPRGRSNPDTVTSGSADW